MLQEISGRSRKQTRFQKISNYNKTSRKFRNEIPLNGDSLTTTAISLACHRSIQINFGGVVLCAIPTSVNPMKLPKVGQLESKMKIQTWTKFGWKFRPQKKWIHLLLWKMVFTKIMKIISTTELWTKNETVVKGFGHIWTNKLLKLIADLISLHLED